jgi:hypothetical protein
VSHRGPLTFKQSDLTRAIKAAKAAGIEVTRIEIDPEGKIVVVILKPDDTSLRVAREIVL